LKFSCNKVEEIMVYDVEEIFKPPGFLFLLVSSGVIIVSFDINIPEPAEFLYFFARVVLFLI